MTPLDRIDRRLEPLRAALLSHPVYGRIRDLAGLRIFLEHHVFAVWDFMSLLKGLQQSLCCVSLPWVPPTDPASARLVNEIVLAEETDEDGQGGYGSHFDLYHQAMRQAGADTSRIDRMIEHLRNRLPLTETLVRSEVPSAARAFVETTFAILNSGELPAIAAAFTFGREDLLPGVFRKIVAEVSGRSEAPGGLERFVFYLDRHIELDGDEHGPMAQQLVSRLCGTNEGRWKLAEEAAVRSLEARLELWNAMDRHIATNAASTATA